MFWIFKEWNIVTIIKFKSFHFFLENFVFFFWKTPRKFRISDVFYCLHHNQEIRTTKKKIEKLPTKIFQKTLKRKFSKFLFVYFCFEFSTLKCQFPICHWALLYNSLIKFFKFFKNPKRFYFLKEVNSLDFTTRFTTVENWKLFHFLAPSVHSICGRSESKKWNFSQFLTVNTLTGFL